MGALGLARERARTQDAVATSDEIVSGAREVDNQQFYDYVVEGAESCYLATITTSKGKVRAAIRTASE